MKRLSIALIALAAFAASLPVRADEEKPADATPAAPVDVKKMIAEFKTAMKAKDPAERLNAVRAVSVAKDAKIAAALAKHLKDRDPEVRAEVCRAIGAQGDEKAGLKLISMLKHTDDPTLLIAICDGIAGTPNKKAIDPLDDIVKDVFNKLENPEVGQAAIRAMGQIKDKRVIEPLIVIAGRTNPTASGSGGSVSEKTRSFLSAFKTDVVAALRNVTGLSYKSPAVWASWWKDAEKRFKIPDGPMDVSGLKRYRDDGYRFQIDRAGDSWKMSIPDGDGVIKMVHETEGEEHQTDATLEVAAWHISDYAVKTVDARIDYWKDWVASDFKDVKESEVRKFTASGEKGKEYWVKGLWGGFPVEIRRIVIIHKDLFFDIRVYTKTSTPQAVKDALDAAIKSFKLF